MKSYDFIFSNRLNTHLFRHFIFWVFFSIYFYSVNLIPARPRDLLNGSTYLNSLKLMIYAPVNIFAVYTALLILLPRYIYPGKYITLLLVLTGLTGFYFTIAWLLTILFAALSTSVPYHDLPISFRWFQPVRYGIGFPLTSTVFVIIFKLFKNDHLKQKENERLLRQKITTELQLLKTKFQPQFLYNALQHILYLTQNKSPGAASTLLNLSELLSYVIYENEKEYVPLEKELESVKTFLLLKKAFYSDSLRIHYNNQVESGKLFISPLALLSIIETCLDNLSQNEVQQTILSLNIETVLNELHFRLEFINNNENESEICDSDNKLLSSLRRIELLYAGRNSLDLRLENGKTYLKLILKLNETSTVFDKYNEMPVLA